MKRGGDGVAVKVSVPLQGTKKLWEPQEDSFLQERTPRGERKDNLIMSKGHGKCKFRDLVLFACSDKLEVIYRFL